MIGIPPLMLVALLLLAVMLTAMLVICWLYFGRSPHTLSWALAFGLSCMWWAGKIALSDPGLPLMLSSWWPGPLAAGAILLFVRGFRQRAGRAAPWWLLVTLWLAASVALIGVIGDGRGGGPGLAVPPLLIAAALLVCIVTLRPCGAQSSTADRGALLTLMSVLICQTGIGFVAILAVAHDDPGYLSLYREIVALALPSFYAGLGLFVIFLIAADISTEMKQLARTDALTGVLNRRGFETAAAALLMNRKSRSRQFSLAVADLDRFKQVNDGRGHAAGDAVLKAFAQHVTAHLAPQDLFGRIGGEEFAILFVDQGLDAACERAEAIRRDFARLPMEDDPAFRVTVSLGLAEIDSAQPSLTNSMAQADAALYRAKQHGRDRVIMAAGVAVA